MGWFFLGLTTGILATCTGSALVVWQLIRRAPRIEPDAARCPDCAATAEECHSDTMRWGHRCCYRCASRNPVNMELVELRQAQKAGPDPRDQATWGLIDAWDDEADTDGDKLAALAPWVQQLTELMTAVGRPTDTQPEEPDALARPRVREAGTTATPARPGTGPAALAAAGTDLGRPTDEPTEADPWTDDERRALMAMQMRTAAFQSADGPTGLDAIAAYLVGLDALRKLSAGAHTREQWDAANTQLETAEQALRAAIGGRPAAPTRDEVELTNPLGKYEFICEQGHHTTTSRPDYERCTAVTPWPSPDGTPCGADISSAVVPASAVVALLSRSAAEPPAAGAASLGRPRSSHFRSMTGWRQNRTRRPAMADETCRFCDGEPDDWCPACGSFLCPTHTPSHDPSLDRPCRQDGEQVDRIEWCGTFRTEASDG